MFQRVTGRNADSFKKSDGTLIHGEYFTHLLYFRNWVQKFQVIQKDYQTIVYKIVQTSNTWQPSEQEEIIQETKRVMGPECSVSFELVDQIPQISSGKYRYTISEVASK